MKLEAAQRLVADISTVEALVKLVTNVLSRKKVKVEKVKVTEGGARMVLDLDSMDQARKKTALNAVGEALISKGFEICDSETALLALLKVTGTAELSISFNKAMTGSKIEIQIRHYEG